MDQECMCARDRVMGQETYEMEMKGRCESSERGVNVWEDRVVNTVMFYNLYLYSLQLVIVTFGKIKNY